MLLVFFILFVNLEKKSLFTNSKVLCFQDSNSPELCQSCNYTYYSPDFLFSNYNMTIRKEACASKKNSTFIKRQILITANVEIIDCIRSGVLIDPLPQRCENFTAIINDFEYVYQDIYSAFFAENLMLAPYLESNLTIFILEDLLIEDNRVKPVYFFFKNLKINLRINGNFCEYEIQKKGECTQGKQKARITIKSALVIFISSYLEIKNVEFLFTFQFTQIYFTSQSLFTLELIADIPADLPPITPTINISNCCFKGDRALPSIEFGIITILNAWGDIICENLVFNSLIFQASIIFDEKIKIWEYQEGSSNINIRFHNLYLSDIHSPSGDNTGLFNLNNFVNSFIIQNIYFYNCNNSNGNPLFHFNKEIVQNLLILKKIYFSSSWNVALIGVEDIYAVLLENITFENLSFPESNRNPIILIIRAKYLKIDFLNMFLCLSYSSPLFYFSQVKSFTITLQIQMVTGFDLQILNSEGLLQNLLISEVFYEKYIVRAFDSNVTLSDCLMEYLEGLGSSILFHVGGSLNIFYTNISDSRGVTFIIEFNGLSNHIISHSHFNTLNTTYFWSRNTHVLHLLMLKSSFSNTKFLRFQSLYKEFDAYPLLIFKDSLFQNLTLEYYGFDYCCIDYYSLNNSFINFETEKGFLSLYSLEQGGAYHFHSCKYIDIGCKTYERSLSGSSNQGIIVLWYQSAFSLLNSSFILTKKLGLRSGFLTSEDFPGKIIVQNCEFIVKHPSIELPVRGFLLLTIGEVRIMDCTFVNITADIIDNYFTHYNGVISLLGSLSFSEIESSQNTVYINKIKIKGSRASNGAAITVVSYNVTHISDCDFLECFSLGNKLGGGYGGCFALFGLGKVLIKNSSFFRSTALQGGFLYLKKINTVFIENCFFENSNVSEFCGAFCIQSVETVRMFNITVKAIFALGSGGFVMLSGGSIYIYETELENINTETEGGVIFLENTVNSSFNFINAVDIRSFRGAVYGECEFLEIENSFFKRVTTESDGSVISVNGFSGISFRNTGFALIICLTYCTKGVILLETPPDEDLSPYVYLNNITFINIDSIEGSLFYTKSDIYLSLENILIKNISAFMIFYLKGTISLEIKLSDVKILACRNYGPSVFYLSSLKLKGFQLSIQDNEIHDRILYGLQINLNMSNLSVGDNVFFENYYYFHVNHQENFFELIESTFYGQNLSLQIITSWNHRGINSYLFITLDSILNIEACKLNISQDSNILNAENTDVKLKDCFFKELSGIAAQIIEKNFFHILSKNSSSVLILNSQFSFITVGTVLALKNIKNLLFQNSTLVGVREASRNSLCLQGFYIENIYQLTLADSHFENLKSRRGGAILIFSVLVKAEVLIQRSSFNGNTAGIGAVLYLEGNFNLNIFQAYFKNNLAYNWENVFPRKSVGGVAYLGCSKDELVDSCLITIEDSVFTNNIALDFASTIFSQTLGKFQGNKFFLDSGEANETGQEFVTYPIKIIMKQNGEETQTIFLRSGATANISFYLTDWSGKIMRFDKYSSGRIQKSRNETLRLNIQNNIAKSLSGVLNFNNFLLKGPSGKNFTLYLLLDFISDPIYPSLRYEFEVPTITRECKLGEIIELDLTCRPCPKGTYSFGEVNNSHECKKCMENFDCRGGDEVYPLPGYWRLGKNDLLAIKCIQKEVCLGGNKENMTESEIEHGACADGHGGNLCFDCKIGYGRPTSDSVCKTCKDVTTGLISRGLTIFVLLILLVVAGAFFLSRQIDLKATTLEFVIFKLIFSHAQTLTIVVFMEDLSLVPSFGDIFDIQSYLSFINDDFFSLECFIKDNQYSNLYKTLGVIILPLATGMLSLIIWIGVGLFYYFRTRLNRILPHAEGRKIVVLVLRRFLISFAIGAYLLYPLMLKSAFNIPNCMEFITGTSSPRSFLYTSPNIECWTDFHLKTIIFLFFPAVILWGIAFPLFLLYILRSCKHLQQEKIISRNSMKKKKKHERVFHVLEYKIFRFFYEDYKEELYYWEVVIFYKKFFLTGLSSFRELIGRDLKLLLVTLVVMRYTAFVINKRPFLFSSGNLIEIISGVIIILSTLYLALVNFDSNAGIIVGLGYAAFFVNFLFILLLFFYAALIILLAKPFFRKMLQKWFVKGEKDLQPRKVQREEGSFDANSKILFVKRFKAKPEIDLS